MKSICASGYFSLTQRIKAVVSIISPMELSLIISILYGFSKVFYWCAKVKENSSLLVGGCTFVNIGSIRLSQNQGIDG
jgi:hypothetical protein